MSFLHLTNDISCIIVFWSFIENLLQVLSEFVKISLKNFWDYFFKVKVNFKILRHYFISQNCSLLLSLSLFLKVSLQELILTFKDVFKSKDKNWHILGGLQAGPGRLANLTHFKHAQNCQKDMKFQLFARACHGYALFPVAECPCQID